MAVAPITTVPASRLAREWTTHAEATHIALQKRPDDPRAPYLQIRLKVLTYLLNRYGRDAGLGEAAATESRSETVVEICDTLRPVRTPTDLGGILERISEAADDPGDFGRDVEETPQAIQRELRRLHTLLILFVLVATLAVFVTIILETLYRPAPRMRPAGPAAPRTMTPIRPGPRDQEAMRLYAAAYRALVVERDRDKAGRLFRRCVFHYGDTHTMNIPLPPDGSTRLEAAEALLQSLGY